jgi:ATP-dependent protease HslVU (ClpYQ) peptidase subunit
MKAAVTVRKPTNKKVNAKTAISVPQDIFKLSEKLAKKLKVSRSAVFALGVQKLGEEMEEDEMIARINAVCEDVDTSVDPFWKEMQSRTLQKNEW